MSNRHLARTVAMQILFEWDFNNRSEKLSDVIEYNVKEFGVGLGEDCEFIEKLVRGVTKHLSEIDATIVKYAPEWPIEKITIIDRSVLRIGIYELMIGKEVPPKVAINESIEVANDAFLKVFLNIQRYDPKMPFKPWFRRILINTALNHIKKKQKLKISTLMDTEYNIPDTEEILARLGFQELMALVRSLSTAYRTVFNLYVLDGFSHEEISQELGISVGTSKSNLSKARERLRQMILQQMEE